MKIPEFSEPTKEFFHKGDLVMVLLKDAYYEARVGVVLDRNAIKQVRLVPRDALKLKVLRAGTMYRRDDEVLIDSFQNVDYVRGYAYSRICHAQKVQWLNSFGVPLTGEQAERRRNFFPEEPVDDGEGY